MKQRSSQLSPRRWLTSVAIAATLLLGACSGSGPQSSLVPKGEQAEDINQLWIVVFSMAVGVFIIVMVGFFYAIFRFRERKDDDRRPRQVHGNNALEISWTIVPAVILAFLTVPTVAGIFELRAAPTGPDVLRIQVTGHQWWWEFEYPDFTTDSGEVITTANELHIPAGVDVYLSMTSADVIHSFWVPPLNGKRDVVPGRVTNLRLNAFEPTPPDQPILGQCAEFCGLAHADMRLRVYVYDEAGFAAWLDEQSKPAEVPAEGPLNEAFTTFNGTCTACHQVTVDRGGVVETLGGANSIEIDGLTFRSALAPNLTHFGSRETFAGATHPNVDPLVAQWLDNPASLKPMSPQYNDIPSGRILGMPDYGLSDQQIAGLVALLDAWQ